MFHGSSLKSSLNFISFRFSRSRFLHAFAFFIKVDARTGQKKPKIKRFPEEKYQYFKKNCGCGIGKINFASRFFYPPSYLTACAISSKTFSFKNLSLTSINNTNSSVPLFFFSSFSFSLRERARQDPGRRREWAFDIQLCFVFFKEY